MDRTRRFKEKARTLFAKGRYDKAVVAWQEVVKADPRDLRSRLRLGDAYRRLGQDARAIACYTEVADFYARDGLLLKAIAACRLILEVDPGHRDTQSLLADLYARKYGHRPPAPKGQGGPAGAAPASGAATDAAPAAGAETDAAPASGAATDAAPATQPAGEAPETASADDPVPASADDPDAASADAPESASAGVPGYGEIELDEGDEDGEYLVLDEDDLDVEDDEPIDVSRLAPLPPPPPPEARELPGIPLFSDLDPAAFVALLERMRVRRLDAGQTVLSQGDTGDSFFIVASGQLRVFRELEDGERVDLARLGDGHFFGEMALLSAQPRTASVVAEEDSELFELDRALLDDLTEQHPTVAQALQRFYRQRLLANLMATSPLFRPFEKPVRRELVQRFSAVEIPPGEAVLREGEPSDGLYVIMSGEVAVTRGSGFDEITLARLHEGDVFGEMGLLSREAATATVKALRRTTALRLTSQAFNEIMMTHPQILEVVSGLSEERRRSNEARLTDDAVDVEGLLLF